jgi:hypothetical protein
MMAVVAMMSPMFGVVLIRGQFAMTAIQIAVVHSDCIGNMQRAVGPASQCDGQSTSTF